MFVRKKVGKISHPKPGIRHPSMFCTQCGNEQKATYGSEPTVSYYDAPLIIEGANPGGAR